MAIVETPMMWVPGIVAFNSSTPGTINGETLSVANEVVWWAFQSDRNATGSGQCDKLGFDVATVTTSGDVVFGIQGLNSTGTPDGSFIASVTQAVSATGWNEATFTTPVDLTKGVWYAAVAQAGPTGSVPNIILQNTRRYASTLGDVPYMGKGTVKFGGSDEMARVAIGFEDGTYYGSILGWWPTTTLNSYVYNDSDNPDEYALRFRMPCPCRLGGFEFKGDLDGDASVAVYDSGGTILSGTSAMTLDADKRATTALNHKRYIFEDDIDLSADTTYYLGIKATDAALDVRVFGSDANSNGLLSAHNYYGQHWYKATRNGGSGAFTDDTTERLLIGLGFNGFDDGAGGSGGLIVHPGMTGGVAG